MTEPTEPADRSESRKSRKPTKPHGPTKPSEPAEAPSWLDDSAPLSTGDFWRVIAAKCTPLRGHTVTILVILLGFFFVIWSLWYTFGEQLVHRESYHLTRDKIKIYRHTPSGPVAGVPEWLNEEAFIDKLLQDIAKFGLGYTTDQAFELLDARVISFFVKSAEGNPWVRRCVQVQKTYPANLKLVLEFRCPVLRISTSEDINAPPTETVDRDACQMPPLSDEFLKTKSYTVLYGIDSTTSNPPAGVEWPDPKVREAVQIVNAFGDKWERLGVQKIKATTNYKEDRRTYVLYGVDKSTILWGESSEETSRDTHSNRDKAAQVLKEFPDGILHSKTGKPLQFSFQETPE